MRKTWIGLALGAVILVGTAAGLAGEPGEHAGPAVAEHAAGVQGAEVVVRCPVTGEEVPQPAEALKSEYKGQTYYFCCAPCKVDFDKDPERYLKREK